MENMCFDSNAIGTSAHGWNSGFYDDYLELENPLKLFSRIIFWYGFLPATTAWRDLFISGVFEVPRVANLTQTLQNNKISKPDQKFSNCIFNPR